MNAKRVNAAAGVILAAQQTDRTPAGIALALDSAQLLMSPEIAAELERLRARVAELEAVRDALLAERHVTNEALDDAVQELRARQDEPVQTLRGESADWKRLGFEDPHESPLHRTDRVPHDLPEIRVPFAAETEVEPTGCRYCGIPARVHAQQWKASVGWHKWVLPTEAQIKARMLARRAARTGGA